MVRISNRKEKAAAKAAAKSVAVVAAESAEKVVEQSVASSVESAPAAETPAQATEAVSVTVFTDLVKGDSGEDVLALQSALNGHGFRVKANSVFDLWTMNALKEFQGRVRLPRTGVADAATLAALERK